MKPVFESTAAIFMNARGGCNHSLEAAYTKLKKVTTSNGLHFLQCSICQLRIVDKSMGNEE